MRSVLALVAAWAAIVSGVYLIAGAGVALIVAGVLIAALTVLLGEVSS